ncbi:cytochrome C [Rhizorhabdus histidinilytica]
MVVAILGIGMAAGAAAAIGTAMPGVSNPQRAHVNWMVKCQGCHRPDGQGTPTSAPAMTGQVARLLAVPGGREFLGRVPGVSTAALPDDQLAELLNWTLQRFDAQHVPEGFQPYTTDEIGSCGKAAPDRGGRDARAADGRPRKARTRRSSKT